jgi:hypothetical protein
MKKMVKSMKMSDNRRRKRIWKHSSMLWRTILSRLRIG